MKKKMLLVLSFIVVMMCVLMIAASAEVFTVDYDGKASQTTDDNGRVTLRTEKISSTNASKTFFGWFTDEGIMYEPGETITITGNIKLYEAYGYMGTNKNLPLGGDSQWDWPFIQLQEDIVLEASMSPPWGGCATVDLNGYTITTSAQTAISQQRSGIRFVGEGEIIHTGTGNFFNASSHGYGDGSQRLLIGKNVTVRTNGTLFNYTNDTNTVIPVHIYGDVSCSKVFHITKLEHNLDVKIDAVRLVVTGDSFMTVGSFNGDDAMVTLNILGGNIDVAENATTADYWNNKSEADYASKFTIAISGGIFNCADDAISAYVADGYKTNSTVLDGAAYTSIILSTECAHEYEVTAEVTADCITYASKTYTCKVCQDTYTIVLGDYADHTWKLTNDVPPTLTSVGVKTYECEICEAVKTEKYYVDIANESINVTVVVEDEETVVSVKVSDVFELTEISENQYKLTNLKAFGDYTVDQIVVINIPVGISEINFASNNSTLKKLVINDGAVTKISGFSKCSALTHIEIGAAEVEFVKGCSNGVIQSIKSEKQGAFVVFGSQVFDGKTSITELKLSSYSEYVFGGNSFRNVGITEFVAPDYSLVTFKMDPAFYGCKNLEYVYIGRGIETLGAKPFDYCQKMQKIVLMDVTAIPQEYTFCVENGGEKPVEVYIHSETISLANNTFYQCHGIIVYTNAPITNGNAFSSCTATNKGGVDYPAYTIYYGIGHKYVEAYEAPGCTTEGVDGYKADCPCGEFLTEATIAQKFTAKLTNAAEFEDVVFESTSIPAKGHKEGEVIGIEYVNGYSSLGLKTCTCSVCTEEYVELSPSAPALIVFLGYSTNEARTELTIGYTVNLETLALYEELSQSTVEFGVVGAITEELDGRTPHAAQESGVTIIDAVIGTRCPAFDFIIKGFNEDMYDLEMTMSAYVNETKKDGSKVFAYVQSTQTDAPSSYTLGACIAALESK